MAIEYAYHTAQLTSGQEATSLANSDADKGGAYKATADIAAFVAANGQTFHKIGTRSTPEPPGLTLRYTAIAATADISAPTNAAPATGAIGDEINFTDGSTGAPSDWIWDFGDGTTSRKQNPTHVYKSNGSYTISLNAFNSLGGSTDTEAAAVTIS